MGLLIEVLGLHLMDSGMDRRAAVFFTVVFIDIFYFTSEAIEIQSPVVYVK